MSALPNCFRKFCSQLRKDKYSKLETLELLGEMSSLKFIKGIILEVRQSNCTALKSLIIDQKHLCEADMWKPDILSTIESDETNFMNMQETTKLLAACPVLIKNKF